MGPRQNLLLAWEAVIIELHLLLRCLPFQQCCAVLVLRWFAAVSAVSDLGMASVTTNVAPSSSWAVTS